MTVAVVAAVETTMTQQPPQKPPYIPSQGDLDREAELERQMLCLGAEAVQEAVQNARDKGHFSTTSPARRLLREWLPATAAGIKDWRRAAAHTRGPKPIALPYIQDADANLLALIGLRGMLDAIGEDRPKVVRVAYSIGRWAEHELKMRFWEKEDPQSFKSAQWYFDNEGATDDHRRRGNVVLVNRSLGDKWQAWPKEAAFRVGTTIIEVIIQQTGLFDTEFATPKGPVKNKRSLPIILIARDMLLEWLHEAFDKAEVSRPRFAPTIIPPKPWTSNKDGGYWTPYLRGTELISFKAQHEETRRAASDEYDSQDMPDVYSAVNLVQSVPWRVNRRVLKVVEQCWAMDLQIADLPALSAAPAPPQPEDIETNPEAEKEWRRLARGVKRRNNSLAGHMVGTSNIVTTAQAYAEEERFYFPHKLDFRGRMYSIPSGLSPQGHDLARGLIMFADSKPIFAANRGDYWLALHVANMMDRDKLSNADRLAWVQSQPDTWLAVAEDPVGHSYIWAEKEDGKPRKNAWQALAAILDWAGYLKEGDGYRSCLPVTVDGTCNGLQHLTALIRDDKAAPLVNLLPSEKPHDIYATVAAEWQEELTALVVKGGKAGEQAQWFLSVWGDRIGRAATKRQVMVLPYGGTRDAFFNYTKEAVLEACPFPEDLTKEARRLRFIAVGAASRLLWEICNRRLPGAMALMRWLQECSALIVEGNQPIYWVTPSGFVVRHFYGKQKEGQVDIKLNGKRVQVVVYEHTKDLDPQAQTRGVAPNFVHSLDGAALALTFNECPKAAITHFTGIHDAYGTHAADMEKLAGLLRKAFVKVHESNPIDVFWKGCADIIVGLHVANGVDETEALALAEEARPAFPEMGSLEIRDVLKSLYFFS